MDKRLMDILLTIGIPANLQGYQFLKDSIKLVIKNPECINNITKIMYPQVASKFGTTTSKVERSMRHALEVSFNKGKIVYLNEVFGVNIFDINDKGENVDETIFL